jgi:hypothetical protein
MLILWNTYLYESPTNENHLWGSVLDLEPNGKQLYRAVQLSG